MTTFLQRTPLFAEMGDGSSAGGGNNNPGDSKMLAMINEEINKAFASWGKREMPKLIEQAVGRSLDMDALSNVFLEKLAAQLPSDEEIEQMEQEAAGEQIDQGDVQADGQGQPGSRYQIDPRMNAELLQMRRQNEQLMAQMEELTESRQEAQMHAELADRQAQIQAILNPFPFANDQSREVAFDYFPSRVERNPETGELIVDDLPAADYVKERMSNLNGLLQPRAVGGAGATNSGFRPGAQVPTTEQIKPGMSREERNQVLQHAISQLPANP